LVRKNAKLGLVRIVLLSTYDMGHQPFGLASPAAWLRDAGHQVTMADLSIGPLPLHEIRDAALIALYLPMHTATRIAIPVIQRIRELNPAAHVCCYGLYASLNQAVLREAGVQTIAGGEFEPQLAALADRLTVCPDCTEFQSSASIDRIAFKTPDRTGLPVLRRYPKLVYGATKRITGYTEASRGCKHHCRHCPIVPVYSGSFRVVPIDVVMADIRQQAAGGAEHITFGDPDFFNGPTHARRIVEAFHAEFPGLTYDATIKVEHLLRHRELLPVLAETGCLFVTTAVESLDDAVLAKLDKGHTRADFFEAVRISRDTGLSLAPTFIPFTPWTTRAGYAALLTALVELDLVETVSPVQLALRLLIPSASRLLELPDIAAVIGSFDKSSLTYTWKHSDPAIDSLGGEVMQIVREDARSRRSRTATFRRIWQHFDSRPLPEPEVLLPRTVIPYLEEPWFC
jgi:radical SAM superfamily enzyme YgiQ (UPF0313 family)